MAVKFGGSFRLNKGRQVLHEYRGSTDQLFTPIYRHSFYIDKQFSHQYTYTILHDYTEAVFASIDGGRSFFVTIRYTKAVFP